MFAPILQKWSQNTASVLWNLQPESALNERCPFPVGAVETRYSVSSLQDEVFYSPIEVTRWIQSHSTILSVAVILSLNSFTWRYFINTGASMKTVSTELESHWEMDVTNTRWSGSELSRVSSKLIIWGPRLCEIHCTWLLLKTGPDVIGSMC